jgi:hypothetical protein
MSQCCIKLYVELKLKPAAISCVRCSLGWNPDGVLVLVIVQGGNRTR